MVILTALVALLIGTLTGEPKAGASAIQLRQVFTLGEGGNNPDTMFGDPTEVGVDGAGRLYVVDQLAMRIKVFDRTGAFVRVLGGRGRAAGQFLSITTTHLEPDGTVLVSDKLAGRFTWLPPFGEPRTAPLDGHGITWPRSIAASRNGYFLLYRPPRGATRDLVHEFSADLGSRRRSFGSVDAVTSARDPFIDDYMHLAPGTLARWGDRLVFAPPICEGRLAVFPSDGPDAAPRFLQGAAPRLSFETVPPTTRSRDVSVVNGPAGPRAARIHCRSAGLVPLASGHLVHFSVRTSGRGRALFAEVFSREGALVGSHEVTNIRLPGEATAPLPVHVFSAGTGRVAIIDRTAGAPLVRVYEAVVT